MRRLALTILLVLTAAGCGTPGASFSVMNTCDETVRAEADNHPVVLERRILIQPGEHDSWGLLAETDGTVDTAFVLVESLDGSWVSEERYDSVDFVEDPDWDSDADIGVELRPSQCPPE